jgi:hypothetical protein
LKKYIFLLISSIIFQKNSHSQLPIVTVELGEKVVAREGVFSITLKVRNIEQRPVCQFPEIKDFQKRGSSTSATQANIGGKTELVYKVVQEYAPSRVGRVKLPELTALVNNLMIKIEPMTLVVMEGDDDVFGPLLDDNAAVPAPENVRADAQLWLRSDQSQVFVGQGVMVKLSFLVAKKNSVEMQFIGLNKQMPEILKKLKPTNAWEDSYGITEPFITNVQLNGKAYTEYRLYQGIFYPINAQPLVFNAVNLHVLGFMGGKSAAKKQQTLFFSSQPLSVRCVELPPHPLSSQVPVGTFQLKEKTSHNYIQTGKSFSYEARITGEGYLPAIQPPKQESDSLFDFFPPDIKELVDHQADRAVCEKILNFQVLPKRPGNFALKPYFSWIYFDPNRRRYDTLSSGLTLPVRGQSISAGTPTLVESEDVFDGLAQKNSLDSPYNWRKTLKEEANLVLLLMILGMLYLFWPIRKKT